MRAAEVEWSTHGGQNDLTPLPPPRYATYSLNFISNSPVFYTIRYPDYKPTLLANNEFEKSIALLTALLSNPDSPPTMRELNAYVRSERRSLLRKCS